jgi:hypothetical protein
MPPVTCQHAPQPDVDLHLYSTFLFKDVIKPERQSCQFVASCFRLSPPTRDITTRKCGTLRSLRMYNPVPGNEITKYGEAYLLPLALDGSQKSISLMHLNLF